MQGPPALVSQPNWPSKQGAAHRYPWGRPTIYLQLAGCSLHQFPLVDWATALVQMTSGAATVSVNTPSAIAAISRRFMEFSLFRTFRDKSINRKIVLSSTKHVNAGRALGGQSKKPRLAHRGNQCRSKPSVNRRAASPDALHRPDGLAALYHACREQWRPKKRSPGYLEGRAGLQVIG